MRDGNDEIMKLKYNSDHSGRSQHSDVGQAYAVVPYTSNRIAPSYSSLLLKSQILFVRLVVDLQ